MTQTTSGGLILRARAEGFFIIIFFKYLKQFWNVLISRWLSNVTCPPWLMHTVDREFRNVRIQLPAPSPNHFDETRTLPRYRADFFWFFWFFSPSVWFSQRQVSRLWSRLVVRMQPTETIKIKRHCNDLVQQNSYQYTSSMKDNKWRWIR